MLYLFGRLALSDSLDYHEDFHDDDFRAAAPDERPNGPEANARAVAPDRRLRRSHHAPQADPAGTKCLSN